MGYRVKGPLATFRVAGQLMYVYHDGVLPEGVDKADLKHLLDSDLIEKVSESAPADDDKAPAKSATKDEWEAFARSKGASDADLDGKTKDDLITAYGG